MMMMIDDDNIIILIIRIVTHSIKYKIKYCF